MKKSTMLMIAATVLMTSCGTLSQLASSGENQKFQDGIYSNAPDFRSRTEKAESKAETESLIAQTKESPVYLFGDRKDTVVIPDNHSATIKFDRELGSTTVTVTENPYDWRNNINPWAYYTPYSIGSSWWWSRHYDPWYWNTWSYTPWRYHGWHGSLHIGLWYDPWYGWWDPWYDWYNPWYGYRWHHHYCGWYGGWDPYWGHHHYGPGHGPSHGPGHIGKPGKDKYYGPRHETEIRNRVVAKDNRNSVTSGSSGVSSNRRGIGTSSSTGRGTISSGTSSRRPASGAVKNSSTSSSRRSSSSTYRRPSTTSGTMSRGSSSSSQSRGTVSRDSGTSSYERSSSSYSRSSSGSYNRGSSSSYGRSSGYSGGGGGGYSRGSSGSSSGGSRRR